MSDHGSVSGWLGRLRAGDTSAARPMWDRYYRRMVAAARQRLGHSPRRLADEEDVALEAFASFCRDLRRGNFPELEDRDDLWRLLLAMTSQKAVDQLRRQAARKRGPESPTADPTPLEELLADEPPPDFIVQMAEECQRLLDRLPDERLRQIAEWRLEGYTLEEIAGRLGCVTRTVERSLKVIRAVWANEEPA